MLSLCRNIFLYQVKVSCQIFQQVMIHCSVVQQYVQVQKDVQSWQISRKKLTAQIAYKLDKQVCKFINENIINNK